MTSMEGAIPAEFRAPVVITHEGGMTFARSMVHAEMGEKIVY